MNPIDQKSPSSDRKGQPMKKIVWIVGGICAAALGFLVLGSRRTPRIEVLSGELEATWADHHTAA